MRLRSIMRSEPGGQIDTHRGYWRSAAALLAVLAFLALPGCGGGSHSDDGGSGSGGGGSGGGESVPPAGNWDSMTWDQSNWG